METSHTTPDSRWKQCLRLIQQNVSAEQFSTWFAPIHSVQFDEVERKLSVCVPSPFFKEYIEAHFLGLLRTVLTRVYGDKLQLFYVIKTDATNGINVEEEATDRAVQPTPRSRTGFNQSPRPLQELDSQLNANYTFENFVEGDSNKLPRTVGMAIAQNPRQVTFNPLFIYGPSGVGKTHLVNAIGTRLKALHPEKRVLYVSAHLFQVQYTDSVRQNTVNDFISFYQSIDVLIIDDVQEFASLQKTQQTFFHIFNHLHQNGRHLILTSDRPPVALQGMEERLLTRFKWGLLAELERPGEMLRRDILRSKIRHAGLRIPDSVVEYIARNVSHSVRDLEGVVHSLMVYSVVWNREIDVTLTQQVILHTLGAATSSERTSLTPDCILDRTCEYFSIDRTDVLSSSRKASVVQARQVAMYLTHKHTHLSTTKIGRAIGGRNHATVLHSCQSVEQRLTVDSKFRQQLQELESLLA